MVILKEDFNKELEDIHRELEAIRQPLTVLMARIEDNISQIYMEMVSELVVVEFILAQLVVEFILAQLALDILQEILVPLAM